MNSLWEKPHNMRSTPHRSPFLLFTLILLSASAAAAEHDASSECESKPASVSFELVHRHDPRIPGNENLKFDKYEANRERVMMDMHRRGLSMYQMKMFSGSEFLMSDYYVQLSVGTPPQDFWMIADTGSNLAWIKCSDDVRNQSDTRDKTPNSYHRRMSKTYKPLACIDPLCKSDDFLNVLAADTECLHDDEYCTYSYAYSHGTIAFGDFGKDVVTLGEGREAKGTLDDMIIGCTVHIDFGIDNEGDEFKYTDGILGLGYTPTSFMFAATKQYGNKFSYCLMDHNLPLNSTNFLTLGSYETSQTPKAALSGPMQRTKLIITEEGEYGVQIEGISIGGQMLQLPAELWDFKTGGGMTLDSGASLTALAKPAFHKVGQEMMKALAPKYKIVLQTNSLLRYCFTAADNEDFDKDVPKLAFHFADGVVYEPPVRNYVLATETNLQCLGLMPVVPASHKAGLIGNIMQQLHLWEFDLTSMTVGFAPSQCTF